MNKELAISKGLIEKDNETVYRLVEKIYKYLFELYLVDLIDLKSYDNEIHSNTNYIGKATINDSDKNTTEYLNLKYFIILNNFFVEKLSIEDITKIKEYIKQNKFTKDVEMLNIVEKTYKDVIKNNYYKGKYVDTPYKICYGSAIPNNFVPNDAVVFKIIYGKNTTKLQGHDFIENAKKQEEFLKGIVEKLKKEVNEKLNINCEVIIDKVYR